MKLRVLIADDEPLASKRLRELLDPDVDVVAECADGTSAVAAVHALEPDALLLDIQMPDMDGFAILGEINKATRPPKVIFVTGYDRHAVRAFEERALDYLLKPVTQSRLREALDRVREWKSHGDISATFRIALRDGGKVNFVEISSIGWIEAADNYALVHAGKITYIVRETMTALMARLPEQTFLRVSRSAIVNISHVRSLQRQDGQNWTVLTDGQQVSVTLSLREIEKRIHQSSSSDPSPRSNLQPTK